jgi:hypothetical protein
MRIRLTVIGLGLSLILPTSALAHAEQATGPITTSTSTPTLTSRAAPIAGTPAQILTTVPAVSPLRTGFKQGLFPSLTSKAKDKYGCTFRNEMLIKLSTKKPRVGKGCKITGGQWSLDFGTKTTTKASDVKLAKLVPDAYIYGQGAYMWTPAQRAAFTTTVAAAKVTPAKATSTNRFRSKPMPVDPGAPNNNIIISNIINLNNYIIPNFNINTITYIVQNNIIINNIFLCSNNGLIQINKINKIIIDNADPNQAELVRLKAENPKFYESWTLATLLNFKAWGLSLSPNVFANFQVTVNSPLNENNYSLYAVPNEAAIYSITAVPQIASEIPAGPVLTIGEGGQSILTSYGTPTMPAVGRDLFGIHAPADWFSDIASGFEGPTNPATIPSVPVGYVRLWDTETTWRDLEPKKGAFVWRKLSKQIETAQALNAKVMLVLGGTPAWAGSGGVTDNPKNIDDWRSYVKTVACKYGASINAYEVWNEANLQTFYGGTPAQMADLTLAAFQEIRSCNPSALVVAANTTSRATNSFATFFPAYLAELKTRNWPADAYSVHSYPSASGGADDRIKGIGQFRTMLALAGAPFTTVFDSEINYGLAGLGEGKADITGDKAMALLSRTYIDSVRYGFGSTFWYVWTKAADGKFGIQLTPSNTDEQQAWRQTYDWLIGAQLQRCATPREGLVVCQFSKGAENFSLVWYGDIDSPLGLNITLGTLGSVCQTLRGTDCSSTILKGTTPVNFMPVRISGAPSAASAVIPASISMTPTFVGVNLNEVTPLTVTVLDGAGKPVVDQEVRATATGSARFEGGNSVTNGRTNAQGQLQLKVTRVGVFAFAPGSITAVPDTGLASLKATSTLMAKGIALQSAVMTDISQGRVTGTAPDFANTIITVRTSSPTALVARQFNVKVDAQGNFSTDVTPVRSGWLAYALDLSSNARSNSIVFR